jgi:hypothetical protein
MYHVKYEDGDSEDFDQDEYIYAYALRQAVDRGKLDEYEDFGTTDIGDDGSSSVEGTSADGAGKCAKRSRQPRAKKNTGLSPCKRFSATSGDGVQATNKRRTQARKLLFPMYDRMAHR